MGGGTPPTAPKFVRLLGALRTTVAHPSTTLSITITTTAVPIGHNVVVVWHDHRQANSATIADSAGNVYNVHTYSTGSGTFTRTQLVAMSRLTKQLGVGDTITVTSHTPEVPVMMAFEYENLPGTPGSLLQHDGASPQSLTTTPLRKPAFLLSTGESESSTTPNVPTVAVPFTLRHYVTPVHGAKFYPGYAYADAIVDSLTPVTATWTWPHPTGRYQVIYLLRYT